MTAEWQNGTPIFQLKSKKNVEKDDQTNGKNNILKEPIMKNTQPNSWTLTVEDDPETGDAILTFPPDLLEQAGWKEGDTINWIDQKDGSWRLVKVDKTTEKSV